MSEIPVSQLIFIVVMGVLLLLIVPVIESRTGKSLTELLFGFRRKSQRTQDKEGTPAKAGKEPRINNGTKGELLSFISQLITFARKNGMQVVAPGTVTYNGNTARLSALLVTPGGVTGIYCLGFGGTITGTREPHSWRQHINGEDKTFPNPLTACQEQKKILQGAMDNAGIRAEADVVTVFTNPRATLCQIPSSRIHSQPDFMKYLKETSALRNGSLDVKETARQLAGLADVKGRQEEAKEKKKKKK